MYENEVEDYDPEDLVIGTAYIKTVGREDIAPSLGGTVYMVPLDGSHEGYFYKLIQDIGLPDSVVCEDEFGNAYLWVIGE